MARETETQLMAELPLVRLPLQTPPFHYTACDYFGPFTFKVGRNKKAKHYGVIFTCLNTTAVDLEMAVDCTTMELMQVMRRFFAVRGCPAVLLSDNGSQMVGTARELHQMRQGHDPNLLRDFCAKTGTQWIFTTPAAPHQNGYAEALVKCCKRA